MESVAYSKKTKIAKVSKKKRNFKELWVNVKYYKQSYFMMLPYLILFLVFTAVPVFMSILLSFTNFDMLNFPKWVGWLNYIRLFLYDDVFLISVKNTLIFAFVTGPLSYCMCLILAWLVNELPPKFRALLTLLFYAPSISGNLFMIWSFIFSNDAYGLVNGLLIKWGFITKPIEWLLKPEYNLKVIIFVQLWLSLGTGFLAFIAGLQGCDKSLAEAGAVDGIRNRFQELWFITLPQIKPQLLFGAVMQITSSFAVCDVNMALAGFPSTKYSTRTVVEHIIDYGTVRFEMGYASSIAVVLFLTMVITNYLVKKFLRNVGQ